MALRKRFVSRPDALGGQGLFQSWSLIRQSQQRRQSMRDGTTPGAGS
jgi:hypothetical protein